MNEELRSHRWNEKFARALADECERLQFMVEDGTYPSEWGGSGLGRLMQEEVDPTARDNLKDAVHQAQSCLRAMSARADS